MNNFLFVYFEGNFFNLLGELFQLAGGTRSRCRGNREAQAGGTVVQTRKNGFRLGGLIAEKSNYRKSDRIPVKKLP